VARHLSAPTLGCAADAGGLGSTVLRRGALPIVCLLLACGGDDEVPRLDAGPDGGSHVGPGQTVDSPAPPAEPLGPDFGDCRPGWVRFDDDGLAACDPFPSLPSPASPCADHEALFPGTPGCLRIGTPCTDDGWPEALPAAGVVYVRAGATSGDGTRGAPFGAIGDATAVATAGTTIALARGEYLGSVPVAAGVTLRGACVEGTTLRATDTVGTTPVVEVAGVGARIENLTITGARPGVRVRGAGRTATLTAVIIDAATTAGISIADGAEVEATEVVIRRMRSAAGVFGRGINVESGGGLILTRAVISEAHETGILALGGATVRLADVHVRDTIPGGGFGDALGVELGSTVRGAGCILEDNSGVGAYVTTDATLTLEDSIVRRNLHEGLQASFGATATYSRIRLEDNREGGILCDGDGTTVTVTDAAFSRQGHRAAATQAGGAISITRALVRDNGLTRQESAVYVNGGETARSSMALRDVRIAGHPATGIEALGGAEVTLDRIAVTGTRGTGVLLQTGLPTTVRDLHISDTEPGVDRLFGRGFEVGAGAEFTVERLHVERVHELGIVAWESRGTFSDVTLRDVAARPDGTYGRGFEVQGTVVTIQRLLIEGAHGTGLLTGTGSSTTASHVEILDTFSNGPLLLSGHAVTVNSGAEAVITHARFLDNREATVVVFEEGSNLELTDVQIRRSLPRQCTDPRCAGFGGGIGLGIYEGGRATARDFIIAESALIGVQLARGELDLIDGEISGNPIGINLQVPDYPLESRTTRVSFRDNGRNIDAEILPLPDAVAPSDL